jgi:signal transduction histidine kinase
MSNIALRRYAKFTTWSWHNFDKWVTILGWTLGIGAVFHHIILIYVLPWGSRINYIFGQTQFVIFLGLTTILAITYARMPKQYPTGYRWANRVLLLAQLLTLAVVVLEVKGPDNPVYAVVGMVLFVAIHLCSVWGLAPLLPWRTLPRFHVLRLGAETAFVLALVHMILQLILPVVIEQWTATPLVIAAQFRLTGSVGLCFWYIEVYRRFGTAHRRFLILAGCGLLCMFVNDVALLWAIVQVASGASGELIRATSVIWTLQQVFWVLAMYWVTRTPMRWNAVKRLGGKVNKTSTWFEPARQGLLLIALVIVAGIISPSFITTLWLGAALISREAVVMYERERAQHQLAAYAQQADELAVERERTRIARDLHDTIGANLTAIGLQLEACANVLGDHPAVARITRAQHLADELVSEARSTVHNLRKPVAPPALYARIEELVQSDRSMGLKVEVQEQGESRRLSAMTEDALFRVAQEGVTNMRKHAGATHLVIHLDYRDPMHVRLQLKDNGRGVDCTSRTGGRGLDGMRERIRAIGGDVDVQTAPDQGFQLTAEVPA